MGSQLPLADIIRNVIVQHEVGNNYAVASSLSLAPTGQSGYSVGVTQFDFHANGNPITVSNFIVLLQSTTSISGLTPSQINSIASGITSLGGSSLVSPYIQQINKSLQTVQGFAFVTATDAAVLAKDVDAVSMIIAAANQNPNGGGALAYGSLNATAVSELGEYVNAFGSSNLLQSFLKGGPVTLPGSGIVVQSDGSLSLADINNNFISHLAQFVSYPSQYRSFVSIASQAGQASSTGTIIDLPDATISVSTLPFLSLRWRRIAR